MERSDASARRRARWAYELGRLRFAAPYGAGAAAVVVLAGLIGAPSPPLFAALGVTLVAVCIAMPTISRRLAGQVRPGLLAGAVPMIAALASARGHGCADACSDLCAPLCAAAGLVVGAWLGRSHARWGALLVASLTAAVGCIAVGAGALAGALLGLALGTVPALAVRRRV
jgi:hypothetical protein